MGQNIDLVMFRILMGKGLDDLSVTFNLMFQHDYAEALKAFNSIKDQDPRALYQLGVMHFDGLGTPGDLVSVVTNCTMSFTNRPEF